MKTIGLVGGTTWYSSIDYYRYINELANKTLGGDQTAKIILNSVNYGEIKQLTFENDWTAVAGIICDAAQKTQKAGADCILLCANTMHNIAQEVQQAITIPLIHIAESTAVEIEKKSLKKVALLGTKYTMQLPFFRDNLLRHNIDVIIPGDDDIEKLNGTIYNELGKGIFSPETKLYYMSVIGELVQKGAEGIILGCTEIPLLIKQVDCNIPLFDTTFIHASAAVDFALSK